MTVVSNTSPLCYVILIGSVDILPRLYGEIQNDTNWGRSIVSLSTSPPRLHWARTVADDSLSHQQKFQDCIQPLKIRTG